MAIAQNFPNIVPSLSLDFANVKALDPRITFNRASTATYYGTETAKAEENLLRFSQEFDNAGWVKTDATVAANSTTAPDGTTTAETITETATTNSHRIRQTVAVVAGLHTFSCFVKKGNGSSARDFIQFALSTTPFESDSVVNFNIVLGTVTQASGVTSASITDAGNGWYRCVVIDTASSAATASVFISGITSGTAAAIESYAGSTDANFFLWGAQLEQRNAVTAYTPTTTQPITNFIPVLESAASGVARFDHNPVTKESLGLLIEEQRTNLLLRSEEFDNAGWTKQDLTVIANTIVAPDGTLTADAAIPTTASSAIHRIRQDVSTSAVAHTITVYGKSAGFTKFGIVEGAATGAFATFDLSGNGSVISSGSGGTGAVVAVGNGWYRCSITFTATTTARAEFRPLPDSYTTGSPNITFAGDGFSGIFIWGASLEQGAFSTSYIPTVASQVTRAADAASMTGANFSSWYNAAEGTLYSEAFSQSARSIAGLGQGTFATNIVFNVTNLMRSAGSTPSLLVGTAVAGSVKLAGAIKPGDFAASANGAAAATSTENLTTPFAANQLQIGASAGSGTLNGTIKKIAYYPVRVTNAQLQALTS